MKIFRGRSEIITPTRKGRENAAVCSGLEGDHSMAIPMSSSLLRPATVCAASCTVEVLKDMKKPGHKDWDCCTKVTGLFSPSSLVDIKLEIWRLEKVYTAHQIFTLNIGEPHDKTGALSSRCSLENTSLCMRENSQEKPSICLQVADRSPEHKATADVEESNGLKGNIKCFHLEILHFKGHCMNSGVKSDMLQSNLQPCKHELLST